ILDPSNEGNRSCLTLKGDEPPRRPAYLAPGSSVLRPALRRGEGEEGNGTKRGQAAQRDTAERGLGLRQDRRRRRGDRGGRRVGRAGDGERVVLPGLDAVVLAAASDRPGAR